MLQSTVITWTEPNRENAPPLHIANRGARYPTLTGVSWLSEYEYVVAHRCGLRLALFDLRVGDKPICMVSTPHRADDVSAKNLEENKWEVTISGCYDAVYTTYDLELGEAKKFRLNRTIWAKDFSFSHGVKYDAFGNLCISIHTGEDPRIEIADRVWRIPRPWGVRNICFNPADQTYYAIAVSHNPQLTGYDDTATSIWFLSSLADEWQFKFALKDTHSDDCDIFQNRLWMSDQRNDRIIGVCLKGNSQPVVIAGDGLDFPHGLAVSRNGQLAVTNYGSSSVIIFDLMEALREHYEFHQAPK